MLVPSGGISANGRARALHARGSGIENRILHNASLILLTESNYDFE